MRLANRTASQSGGLVGGFAMEFDAGAEFRDEDQIDACALEERKAHRMLSPPSSWNCTTKELS